MTPYITLIVCGIIFFIITARDNDFLAPIGPIVTALGASGLLMFLISEGSLPTAKMNALILAILVLTAPVLFVSHWLVTKLFEKLDAETDALRAKTINRTGTISHPIDVMDMGRMILDSPTDEESEFEVLSSTHMAVGTRVVVRDIMGKRLSVKPIPFKE